MATETLLTVEEVAAYLSFSTSTVYGWRSRGYGPPAVKVGARVRYRLSDVDTWVQAHLEPEIGED